MRIHFRKALALMISLLMLCTLLPLGAMTSVSAATNLVSNGTFESDTSGWNTSSTITRDTSDPGSGSASLKLDCTTVDYAWTYVTVQVEKNTDYVLSFKGKTASAGLMVNFQSNWADISAQIPRYTVGSTSSWKDCEYEFNSGDYSSIMMYFQSSWAKGTGSYVWIDDVSVVKKEVPEAPAAENLITNGSFEDGNNGWTLSSSGSIVSGGQDGSSALQMKDPSGQYSGIAYQYVTVEPGKGYTLTWYAKRVSGTGVFNLYLDGGSYSGQQNWMNETSGNWVQYKIEFTANATTTSLLVKFSNEAANTVGTVLIDNVVMTKNPEASFDGYLTNGDFEIGTIQNWTAYNGTAASADAAYGSNYGAHLKGNGSWGGIMSQGTVNVVAGKTYTVSYYIKVLANGMNLQIKDGTTAEGDVLVSQKHPIADYGSWTLVSLTVTPSTNGLFINFCGTGSSSTAVPANAESAYVDNIMVVEEKDPSNDGYISNGDFETGKTTPWTVYSSTAVDAVAKYEGNYGLKLGGDGGWGGLAYQQIKNLKSGQDYTVTMWVKVVSGGVNIQVKGTNLSGDSITAKYMATNNAGSWTELTLTFTAAATYGYINICGDGTGTAAVVYIDNVKVSRVGGEVYPEELISYGGSSIKENSDGIGLAFRFEIDATGGQKMSTNEYIESSASITLDDKEYKVVRMGAVMTNKQSVGTTDFTLDAINENPGRVIDIPAVYLASLSSDTVSFAVRIIDIPEDKTGTEIYARPYYVYLENGVEVTVYGDIKSNNYDKAANPKASIKILSIGHSFSKDVMETYLWNMFKEGGYDEVVIGYLYMGGCSMPKHLHNINNNLAQYEYGKNSNGTWVKQNNVAPLTALQDEEWDYVNIQSSPDYIGGQSISSFKEGVNSDGDQITLNPAMTEYECITPITNWIQENATNKAVKTDYNMIWSFSEGCNLWSYTYHNYNQMTMYNNIVNMTQTKVVPHTAINDIIPCATSIQNARSSFIGDNFNMPDATQGGNDGYHLNDTGDYTAALTWYCHYSGDDANIMNGYTGNLTNEQFLAIAEAVNNAIDVPFAVTESTYTEG